MADDAKVADDVVKVDEDAQMAAVIEKLGKEKVDDYKAAWDMFDKEKKGEITAAEFDKILQQLDEKQSENQRKEVIKQLDKDGDGNITWLEFLNLMQEFEASALGANDEYKQAFDLADTNNDGKIDKDELKALFAQMGDALTDDQIQGMLTHADKDGDGNISFDEFIEMLNPNGV